MAGDGCKPVQNLIKIRGTSWYLFRFIVDGIITIPIALYGFLVFPDLPHTTKAFYLSEEVSTFMATMIRWRQSTLLCLH